MDPDRLVALVRAFNRRDFTGWHHEGWGSFVLDFGEYSVRYSCDGFCLHVERCWFSGRFRIGRIEVHYDSVVLRSVSDSEWCLEDRRERGRPVHMRGAPLRSPDHRVGHSDCYYNEGWPELAETSPVNAWVRWTNRERDQLEAVRMAKIVEAIECEDSSGLFPHGIDATFGYQVDISVRADVVPAEPSDVDCTLRCKADRWTLFARGRGEADRRVGFSAGSFHVDLVMTPHSSGVLEGSAGYRARRFRQYRDEHPPEDLSYVEAGENVRDCRGTECSQSYDWLGWVRYDT